MKAWAQKQKGFTIVELLIVIVVIGILASITIVSYNGVQARAKDSRRLNDTQVIVGALQLYYAENGVYPTPSYNGPGGWESSSINPSQFLQVLKTNGIISSVPVDPVNTATAEYRYYRYPAGDYGCDAARGAYFVFGIINLESSQGPSSQSPGWLCPSRDWETEFDWVTGGFER